MRRKKKTTIVTFEWRERMTIRSGQQRFVAWCDRCCAEVLMISPHEAATTARTDSRAIFKGIEAGDIHFVESGTGEPMICSTSIVTHFKRNR